DLVLGGWDPMPDNAFEAACNAGVLSARDLLPLRGQLEAIRPMPAVFDQRYVRNLHGENVKTGETKLDLARQLIEDMRRFKDEQGCERLVVVWCGSTETFAEATAPHATIEAFERGLRERAPEIAPSQIYAYAALSLGVPFVNGAPNLTLDFPAMIALGDRNGV